MVVPSICTEPDNGCYAGQSIRVVDLQKLIDVGVIYTDVHTVTRVSPQGLTRGPVRAEDYDNDDGVTASASSQARFLLGHQ